MENKQLLKSVMKSSLHILNNIERQIEILETFLEKTQEDNPSTNKNNETTDWDTYENYENPTNPSTNKNNETTGWNEWEQINNIQCIENPKETYDTSGCEWTKESYESNGWEWTKEMNERNERNESSSSNYENSNWYMTLDFARCNTPYYYTYTIPKGYPYTYISQWECPQGYRVKSDPSTGWNSEYTHWLGDVVLVKME